MPIDQKKPLIINTILNDCSETLTALSTHTTHIQQLQNHIRSELGHPLSDHLSVVNFNQQTLTIHTDSPAWAAKLRFNIQNILKIARQKCGLTELRSVRVKVIIPEFDTPATNRRLSISEDTAHMILKTSESINDDSLRTALLRLSKHNR